MKRKEDIEFFVDYCTGCGLCHSIQGVSFNCREDGFIYPELRENEMDFCKKCCPANGIYTESLSGKDIWGEYYSATLGYATDSSIRFHGSSGGVLSAICIFLLKEHIVDGIIQTKAAQPVYSTKTVISRTEEEVRECIGSRYSASSPLMDIDKMLQPGELYAFVGKPCDIVALRQYEKYNQNISQQIPIKLSFFCAGVPGENAQKKLINALGGTDEKKIKRLSYRGDGWPGFATLEFKDGNTSRMGYTDSWGNILGRDIRKICRFCIDGIGEMADITCADAWLQNELGEVDFTEHEGRNIIFARSQAGYELLKKARDRGYIVDWEDNEYLSNFSRIQSYQWNRRATMKVMLLAMKLTGHYIPRYNNKLLNSYSRYASPKIKARRFMGIIKRSAKGSL